MFVHVNLPQALGRQLLADHVFDPLPQERIVQHPTLISVRQPRESIRTIRRELSGRIKICPHVRPDTPSCREHRKRQPHDQEPDVHLPSSLAMRLSAGGMRVQHIRNTNVCKLATCQAETVGTLFISLRKADLNLTDRSIAIFPCRRPNWKPGKWRST